MALQKRAHCLLLGSLFLLVACATVSTPAAEPGAPQVPLAPGQLRRSEYADRLRAMWLGETIANWTGLTTEGVKEEAPFYTDADWGLDQQLPWKPEDVIDFVFQDPWLADDDTDIEYVYMHLVNQYQTALLSPDQIAAGWQTYINDYIWVSNQEARSLMRLRALPPVTGMPSANRNSLMIDAQLTTEIFGALAPGMPARALQLADLPIRTTASGYAAHAAQFYVVLYSLATQVDPDLSGRDQVIWLVEQARRYIPDTSKTADIADFVLADFLDNPQPDDWESTRDRVYERYHRRAAAHGFVYRDWVESSVNFGSGLIALLYGQGDFRRTVQIGALSGWDSDNGTATMGGLLGLMMGYDSLAAQFPERELSDRYRIHRSRPEMPDLLPADPDAQDTFAMMAQRMLPWVEATIRSAGGMVAGDVWTLPEAATDDPLSHNPLQQLTRRSANNQVRRVGGTVNALVSGEIDTVGAGRIADGVEHDFSGQEVSEPTQGYRSAKEIASLTLTVTYDRPVTVQTIRLVEGGGSSGFSQLAAELRGENGWQAVPSETILSAEPDPALAYQIIDFILPAPIPATGIRLTGEVAGPLRQATILELDALAP
jgi:hypothetical protein